MDREQYSMLQDMFERTAKMIGQLNELHREAANHIPRSPNEEERQKLKEMRARTDKLPVENLRRALDAIFVVERVPKERLAEIEAQILAWEVEEDVHKKALLQMDFVNPISLLMEHIDALEDEIFKLKAERVHTRL